MDGRDRQAEAAVPDALHPMPRNPSFVTRYQITIRYGSRFQRYHTFDVEAADVAQALRLAAARVPAEILPEADLVELRVAVDPQVRGPTPSGQQE